MSCFIYHNNHQLCISYHDNGHLQYDYHTIDIIAHHYTVYKNTLNNLCNYLCTTLAYFQYCLYRICIQEYKLTCVQSEST